MQRQSSTKPVFVTVDYLAERWMCSTESAIRTCSRGGIKPYRLTQCERGLRRYLLDEIVDLERRLGTQR